MRLLSPALLVCLLAVCPVPAEAEGTALPPVGETCQGLVATIVGTDGNDQLRGTPGDDVIVGLAGNDVIRGEGGNDVICGGPGNDVLFGDAGDDTLDGGTGKNNVLHGDDGSDVCTNGKPHNCEGFGGNRAPIANAGPDQTVRPGDLVSLDGSISSDPDGDPLTFLWSFVSAPAGSNPTLSDPAAVRPSFIALAPGEYVLRLIVNDGQADSAPDTVLVTTGNSAPAANAGLDQTAPVGTVLTLDGSASTDADGDPLTFHWSILNAPAGSSASFSDPAAVHPTILIDAPGTYLVELIVSDGTASSEPDAIEISTTNSAPIARAGADQTGHVGDTIALDGSGSFDVDGNPLTFFWSLTTVPPGSTATLDNPAAMQPSFTIDQFGTYIAQLVVNDGAVDSDPDLVVINTENSAPTANAGDDRSAFVGDTVVLDGTLSSDVDGNPLTLAWSLVTVPAGSNAVLVNPTDPTPSFDVDVFGTYVAQLIVHDGLVQSAPDTVIITTLNSAPVANAGPDQGTFVGNTVMLDGTASRDADANPLSYRWSLISRPDGSNATLSDPSAPSPSFVADARGLYVAQLIVNDGVVDSAPDTVMISTENRAPSADAGADQTPLIRETVTLSCAASMDPDGDPYTCQWMILSAPAGSVAALSDAASKTPTFTPDVRGVYEFGLVATDDLGAASVIDTVLVSTLNRAPTAEAGADQSADVAATVTLNGGASTDLDLDPLTYRWSIITAPAGSVAVLVDPTTVAPTFTPDVAGIYVFTLFVSDGLLQHSDTVTLTAVPPRIRLTLVGTPFLGVGRIAQAQVELPAPAPAGGVTVTVTSDDTAILDVVMPGTVLIAEGETTGLVSVAGIAPGDALLLANAPGFDEGAATMTVTNKVVDLPPSFSVPLGQQAALTVSIGPDPAPAGGVTIQLTTSDENIIAVSAFVTILPGEFSANALVTGVRPGTAIVTATNPDFATDSTPVSTAVQLDIVQGSATFSAGLVPPDITVRLLTSGVVVPAPAPGVDVTFTSSNPECATAPSFSLPTGISTKIVSLSYGGTTSLPCTATLTASSPGVTSDAMTVTVNPKLGTTFHGYPYTAGAGLHSTGTRWARLGAANHGGTTVRIESRNPELVLVSRDAATPGQPFVDVNLANGQTDAVFVVHGLEGVTGVATIDATSDKFNGASTSITVAKPAVRLNGVATAMTVFQTPDLFQVQIGVPTATGTNLSEVQSIRPGGTPVSITVTSSNPAVAAFVSGAGTADSVTLQINPGQSITSNITMKPLSAGTTTVSVTPPAGYGSVTASSAVVTVTGPGMTFHGLPYTVGAGMHSTGTRWVRLGASNHGGVRVRIESKQPGLALVSRNLTTVGQPFIEVDLPDGQTDLVFVSHGLEGVTGAATIEVTAPGFTTSSTTVTVAQPAARLNGVPSAMTVFQTPDLFQVQIGVPNATGTNLVEVQSIRPGGTPVSITVTSSNPAVAGFVSGATTAGSVTLQINPGQSITSNVTMKPLSAGTTTVSVAPPAGYTSVTTSSVGMTVTGPGMTFHGYPYTVGAGMHSTGTRWVRLGASNHGGVRVRIESKQPGLALVSLNTTTVGQPAIEVDLADGQTDVVFVVHGLEGVTGGAPIEVTASGFTTSSTTVTVAQPAARLNGVPTALTVFTTPDTFNVQIGVPSASGANLSELQNIRPGGTAVSVTVGTSQPSVAAFLSGATTVDSLTVTFNPGQSSVSGLLLKPLTEGSATIAVVPPAGYGTVAAGAVTVNVTTPGITFSGWPATVGAGLTSTGTRWARLGATNHGGITVRVQSSNPEIALVSPNSTTVGTPFIDVDLPNGQSDVVFQVHGLEGASGNVVITVSAPGFSDANTTASIQPAAIQIAGLLTTAVAGGAVDAFIVQIGVADATGTDLAGTQNVRPGGPGRFITISSSNPAAGRILTSTEEGASVTVLIPAGQSQVAASFRPVAAGQTQVSAVATDVNVIETTEATVNVTVQ